jgi:outer membrane lipoprotein SlyB
MARLIRFMALALLATLLAACANMAPPADTAVRVEYGTVQAIQVTSAPDDELISAGTVLGGIAGGVIGHQIGSGRGNAAATVAGALGGAVVGHEIQKKVNASRNRIIVRLDSGSTLTVEEAGEVDLRVGDRVRVENNRVHRL